MGELGSSSHQSPQVEAVVAQAHARVGVEPVDDRADPERAERGRAVALAVVRREAVVADVRRPRPRHLPPALEKGDRGGRRAHARRDDLNPLRAGVQGEDERQRQHRGAQSTLRPACSLCRRSRPRSRP